MYTSNIGVGMTEPGRFCCKVGRLSHKYGIADMNDRLRAKRREGRSVRKLAKDFNKELVTNTLISADVRQARWDHTLIYEALHTDERSEPEEIEIKRELERSGIDVDELSSDFVSHQTMYRHVGECLEVSPEDTRTPEDRRSKVKETVFALQQRTELVTESHLESLKSAGATDLEEFDVVLDLHVVCATCQNPMSLETAITDGCSCTAP